MQKCYVITLNNTSKSEIGNKIDLTVFAPNRHIVRPACSHCTVNRKEINSYKHLTSYS